MVPTGRGRGYAGRNKDLNKTGKGVRPVETVVGRVPTQRAQMQPSNDSDSVAMSQPCVDACELYSYADATSDNMNHESVSHAPLTNVNQANMRQTVPNVESTTRQFSPANDLFVDENAQSVLYIDNKYNNLIKQVGIFNESDDGILINQKLKHFEGVLTNTCTQFSQLRGAMEAIASAAIADAVTVKKVSKMISYSRIQIHQQRLHNVFIAAARDKIDGLEVSLDGADKYYVNAVTLLTDIYSESKLLTTEDVTILTNLIVQVFIGLLECNTPLALKTLNVQLMLYGKKLYPHASEKFNIVSLSARKRLIARQPPLGSCRIWLALLADQCIYNFAPLPQYLQDFYARHLDELNREVEPRDSFGELPQNSDIATSSSSHKNQKNVDSYQKNQEKRSSINSDSSDKWSGTSNGEKVTSKNFHYDQHRDDVFEDKGVYDSHTLNDYTDINGQIIQERKPRPILGAGSRIMNKTCSENQFLEPPPPINYGNNLVNVEEKELPLYISNYMLDEAVTKNMKITDSIMSASQDNSDYWNYPPPSIPVNEYIKKRLDLNTWRQQNASNNDQELNQTNNVAIYDAQDRISVNEIHESYNLPANTSQVNDNFQNDTIGIKKRINISSDNYKNSREEEQNVNSYNENDHNRINTSYWERKRTDSNNESDKNVNKTNMKQQNDKRNNDNVRNFHTQNKKDVDEKESTWRKKDNDDKPWDGKGGVDKKMANRRDSRGSNRSTKRDTMEVSRKGSYWTHDDRCDIDYNG